MGAWKTVRVFISSTFRDMRSERDWLVKRVFPELRQRLQTHRIHLVDIDLRWGITREQAESNLVLNLCLQQIDECRPFFVGLLGEQYGWVPEQFSNEAIRHFPWLKGNCGKSLTELEMLHGVLNDASMHDRGIFAIRSTEFISSIDGDQCRRIYVEGPLDEETKILGVEESERRANERRSNLRDLKAKLRQQFAEETARTVSAIQQIHEYGVANGKVSYVDPSDGQVKEVRVDW